MKQKIKLLKDYFKERDDVLMAFLFGSQAKNLSTQRSDWDIGIYLKPKSGKIEWENEYLYPQRNEIWGDLVDLLETDNVDLIILNCSTSNIADTAIRGMPLTIKDRRLYLEFMLIITREAMDYRQTVKEYADIYWRSTSLTSEDRDVLNKRLIFLKNELEDIAKFSQFTQFDYQRDRAKKREVERWVENLMNATIDISKALLASEHKDIPETYKKIVLHLYLLPDFSQKLTKKLSNWTDLRNILAHEYLDIRWQRIKEFIQEAEPYFQEFIKAIKKFINA